MVDERLTTPLMTPKDTARHLRIPDSTLYYWLREQAADEPLVHRVGLAPRGAPSLPFIAVIEAYVLRTLREVGITKRRVREIAEQVRRDYETPYGLATKTFATDGIDVYLDEHGELSRVQDGQRPIKDVIASDLRYISWDSTGTLPNRLRLRQYPDIAPVIIDPRFGWGSPVVESNRVPVDTVANLWLAGESIHAVAYEYDVDDEQVEAICRAYQSVA
ncbi:MAG TPA: DUF433 domain-containing protein [Pseudonocardiaceae bacterium]|nr:DUF433 domain-containing protein [Pseudonocardiaceae bacterium]